MARVISAPTGASVYPEVLDVVRRRGARQTSRNGDVYDLGGVTIQLDSPLNALPIGCGRKLNPAIAAAEALQLIGAFSDPAWLCKIAPQFERYVEYLQVSREPWFHGAYGRRIAYASQLDAAVRRLRETPDTRQAVITLWEPSADTEPGHLDYPCTVALNFRRSGRLLNRLDMQVLMRSNDAWRGLPYDMFQFTQLQLTLCNVLNLEPGTYEHTAWSLHLYRSDVDASYDVTDSLAGATRQLERVTGVGRAWSGASLAKTVDRARNLALYPTKVTDPTESELWYVGKLREYAYDVVS